MTNAEVVQRWFNQLWNEGNEATIDELFAPDARSYGLSPEPIIGPEEFRGFYRTFRSSFPSVNVALDQVVESGDQVCFRAVVNVMAADGSGPFEFEGACIVRVRDDQIVEGRNFFDFLGLLTAMGAVPADAMAQALAAPAPPAPAAG